MEMLQEIYKHTSGLLTYWRLKPTAVEHIKQLLDDAELLHPWDENIILDIGAGFGLLAEVAAGYGIEVHSVEPNPDFAQYITSGRIIHESIESAQIREDYYDAVICSYMAGYCDLPELFEKIDKILVPGGRLVFYEQCSGTTDEYQGYKPIKLAELLPLIEEYFYRFDMKVLNPADLYPASPELLEYYNSGGHIQNAGQIYLIARKS